MKLTLVVVVMLAGLGGCRAHTARVNCPEADVLAAEAHHLKRRRAVHAARLASGPDRSMIEVIDDAGTAKDARRAQHALDDEIRAARARCADES